MHEDYQLDENFRVENAGDFLDGLSEEEEEYLLHQSGMRPCKCCGEWVSKANMENGICYLCRKSDKHAEIRGLSENASDNHRTLEDLVDRLEELNNDLGQALED